ncbi:MAG: RraA family protein [Spirochaetia bacterium]|nr:RraA family protein [Spirochaetia bacterium]
MSNIGFRINQTFSRPDDSLVESFRDIPVANICDNMGRIACMDSSIIGYGKRVVLGVAFTVRVPANDNLMLHKAIDLASPGDIIVVDGEGVTTHALMGEIMFRYAISRGIRGFILDGCIRDVDSLEHLDFPVFAKGVNPRGPYKNGPGEINFPISCGGQVVHPGDIISADKDGIVVIRPEDAPSLLIKAKAQNVAESVTFKEIANRTINRAWVDEFLVSKGAEFLK